MFDFFVADLFLSERKIAYAVTDKAFKVQKIGGVTRLLHSAGTSEGETTLFDLAPELISAETELQAILCGKQTALQLTLLNRELEPGQITYVTLNNYPYRDAQGKILGILHLVEDITAIGEAEQRLTQQRNELYMLHQRLSAQNLQLAAANAELRNLDELKSKFVSVAAHELRTPLASILGYVDFVLDDEPDALREDQRQHIEIIRSSARRLLDLTNDLLDVTRIEAGHLELTLTHIDLGIIVESVIREIKPQIMGRQQQLHLHMPPDLPLVLGDESRTIQIFYNLVGNAIKYTPDQGAITVRLDATQEEGFIMAAITDTGIGIPVKDLANLGKNFFRASNAHLSKARGAGLGLSITRSLVELQGGRLWIESQVNQGSTFYVTFPIDDGLLR